MENLFVFLLIVTISSETFGMSFRQKRQSNGNDNDLEDRYGWDNSPGRQSWFPNTNQINNRPWQNQFPRPNQNGGQNQFPWQNPIQNGGENQFPPQNQQQIQPSTPPTNSNSRLPNDVRSCISSCPVTSEYNPVCGTDLVTYSNPGRLVCARTCGVNVSQLRTSPCPTTTVAPIS
ncbi:homeobox protein 5-like [Galleria mellonella]|uniref:Homeobox protein 5-like n=1 Tax=Galleria mellonella TaxID=7137 RepID=A0ABM3MVC8_GALME|nr:homeobox protein 5-like [Galleria mellonella]